MALQLEQIDRAFDYGKSKSRKFLKNNRNRKIRRTPIDRELSLGYKGWEF